MYRGQGAFRPRSFAFLLSWLLLQAPAVWNRFPLLQYDTGGYFARLYEGTLVPSRAVVYGLILNAGAPFTFWPVVALQAALTVWIVALMLRTHGLGRNPLMLVGIVAALTLISTLPWLTSILLTDIFCGLGVLALYLLLMRSGELNGRERIALIVLIAVSAATHSATMAVLLALLACAIVLFFISPARMPSATLARGIASLAFGALLVFAADFAVAGRLAWTPGGFALSFGRMLQDGIVKKYLDEHCPDPALRLCAFKDKLPDDADVWFWGSDLFDELGRFAGLGEEMETIAVRSLIEYPGLQAETAAIATANQLIDVHTGEGVLKSIWHTYAIIGKFAPKQVAAMRAARQQTEGISFEAINRLHYPLALIAMALLPLIAVAGLRGGNLTGVSALAATVTLAILANALVCGALSNPHDRYGARIVWLAIFVVMLALVRLAAGRQGPTLGPRGN